MLTFKEHLSKCTCLAVQDFNNLGNYLIASGSLDTKVKLWDTRQKNSIQTLKSHSKPIMDVKISNSQSDHYVASCS